MNINLQRKMFFILLVMLFVSSFSLSVIPAVINSENQMSFASYLVGGSFWLFMLCGYFILILINKCRKRVEDVGKHGGKKSTQRAGVICFFKNKYSRFADILFAITFILSVIFTWSNINEYITVLAVCTMLFSFHLHCILNGKIFAYLLRNQKT